LNTVNKCELYGGFTVSVNSGSTNDVPFIYTPKCAKCIFNWILDTTSNGQICIPQTICDSTNNNTNLVTGKWC